MRTTRTRHSGLFPGQGSQFEGDGRSLGRRTRPRRPSWTTHRRRSAVTSSPAAHDAAALATTEFVQPALLACDVAAFRVLEAEGVPFVGVAGHSLGEFAALVAAGVVALGDALDLVVVRGAAMQRAGEERPGTMTALLGVGAEDAAALCEEARRRRRARRRERELARAVGDLAVRFPRSNGPRRSRKTGRSRAIRLHVAGAFHSPLMEPARAADRRTHRCRSRSRRRGSPSPRTSPARWYRTRRSCDRS